jgi:hypothetical protein
MTDTNRLQAENMEKFLADGPRLRTDYNVWIEARGPDRVQLGGLGGLGVGSMWVDEEPRHREYPGYDEAPFVADAAKCKDDWAGLFPDA